MSHIPSEVIDDLMEIYCEWREECVWLGTAYDRWREVPAEDRDLAFAAYQAALDREEQASVVYAARVERIVRDFVPKRRWLRLRRTAVPWPAEARSAQG